jgi:hypothetical protein
MIIPSVLAVQIIHWYDYTQPTKQTPSHAPQSYV